MKYYANAVEGAAIVAAWAMYDWRAAALVFLIMWQNNIRTIP